MVDVHVFAILGLAFAQTQTTFWVWSLILGSYFGLTEGAERALVRDLANPAERGTAFGWYHMLVGLSAIPAGFTLGLLWSLFGVKTAFIVSAALAFWRRIRDA